MTLSNSVCKIIRYRDISTQRCRFQNIFHNIIEHVLTGKRRHDGGDGEGQDYGWSGNRFGHRTGQHVHTASQCGAGAQCGQVEERQHPVEFFFARFIRIGLFPRQRPCQRVRLLNTYRQNGIGLDITTLLISILNMYILSGVLIFEQIRLKRDNKSSM